MSAQILSIEKLGSLARHWDQLIRTGQCGPAPAGARVSWGSACPAGFCPPERLPEQLGRYFAGDHSGCREVAFVIRVTTAAAAWAVTGNSLVTMCPTRLIAFSETSAGNVFITQIQFGNQNQIAGAGAPLEAYWPNAVQAVPFVPDCLRAGMPYQIAGTDTANPHVFYLAFIGPMIG